MWIKSMWIKSQDGSTAVNFEPAIRLFSQGDELCVQLPEISIAVCIGRYSTAGRMWKIMDLILMAHTIGIAVFHLPDDTDEAVEAACAEICDLERRCTEELDSEQCSANTQSGLREEDYA